MRKDKNLDELFRDKLLNYEQEPPAYLLENVLAGVAGARRNRKIVIWRIAGVAAALLLAFVAGWQFNIRNGQDIKQPVSVSQQIAPEVSPDVKTQLENAMPDNQQANANTCVWLFSQVHFSLRPQVNLMRHLQIWEIHMR